MLLIMMTRRASLRWGMGSQSRVLASSPLCPSLRSSSSSSPPSLFLHIGPSGDFWTGSSIFAAKHLQPDYVKSIPLPEDICVDTLMEYLEENAPLVDQAYDNNALPKDFLKKLPKADREEELKDLQR